jgi:hypothetical protein
MDVTFLNRVVGLTLVMLCACNAQAGMLEETCSLVYKKLSSGPYESLTKSIESFTDDGEHYDLLNEDGWCGDKMADGPDGTSYRALKKNVFCEVEGRWDGGDDSDPKYVPSPRYEVIVKCAKR